MQINTAFSPAQLNNSQSSTSVQNQQQNIPQQTQAETGSGKTTIFSAAKAVNPVGRVQDSEKKPKPPEFGRMS
jgi:hypothetical protein